MFKLTEYIVSHIFILIVNDPSPSVFYMYQYYTLRRSADECVVQWHFIFHFYEHYILLTINEAFY